MRFRSKSCPPNCGESLSLGERGISGVYSLRGLRQASVGSKTRSAGMEAFINFSREGELMQVIIKGRNIELTSALKAHADEKVSKIGRYFERGTKIEVELSVEKNPSIADNQTVEVTVFADHSNVIRAKQSSSDMYASIDMLIDKLSKRLKKLKDKKDAHHDKHHKESIRVNGFPAPDTFVEEETAADDEVSIVKRKQFSVKPMTPEEAAMEMDLLGHSFFFFTNSETDASNVVYKRRDGNVGLIEPS